MIRDRIAKPEHAEGVVQGLAESLSDQFPLAPLGEAGGVHGPLFASSAWLGEAPFTAAQQHIGSAPAALPPVTPAPIPAAPPAVEAMADQLVDPLAGVLSAPEVPEAAGQDFTVSVAVASNDPAFTAGRQWDMLGDKTATVNIYGSQAAEAWAAGATGSMKNVIGIVDTGIDYTHVDLYQNVWLNQNEIAAGLKAVLKDVDGDRLITFRDLNSSQNAAYVRDINGSGYIDAGDLLKDARWADGIDTDGNGYRDDLIGWDFVNNDNDPFDDAGHGTHVAGTIGATGGNGIGMAGENWQVQMVGLKFLAANGSGSTAGAVQALDYFTRMAAATPTENFVATNNSWGGGGFSQALLDAIGRGARQDILFVAAAGNGGADGIGDNNDVVTNYPSNYNTAAAAGYDAVLAVASLTSTGALSGFSNFGKTTVDLAAPGSSIYSTLPGNSYGVYSGTSMATPHVTGAAALYAALHPTATAAEIKAAIMGSVDATAAAASTVTGGRLDISNLVTWTGTIPPPPPSGPNYVYGSNGNDAVTGTAGVDIISGLAVSGTALGAGTVDRLTGLGGNDIFVLGDARGAYYNDGNALNAGRGDYGVIMDFHAGDKIQLSSKIATYFVTATSVGGFSGTGIYADTNGNRSFDARDELIGEVVGVTSLARADVLFV